MKPIEHWQQAWRLFSVQAAGVAMLFGMLPAGVQSAVMQFLHIKPSWVPFIIGAAFLLARLIAQPPESQKASAQQ
jgi:hypothetical protein